MNNLLITVYNLYILIIPKNANKNFSPNSQL
jgi:hypothetical protein